MIIFLNSGSSGNRTIFTDNNRIYTRIYLSIWSKNCTTFAYFYIPRNSNIVFNFDKRPQFDISGYPRITNIGSIYKVDLTLRMFSI